MKDIEQLIYGQNLNKCPMCGGDVQMRICNNNSHMTLKIHCKPCDIYVGKDILSNIPVDRFLAACNDLKDVWSNITQPKDIWIKAEEGFPIQYVPVIAKYKGYDKEYYRLVTYQKGMFYDYWKGLEIDNDDILISWHYLENGGIGYEDMY